MRLTDAGITKLPIPAKGQKTYSDDTLRGFGCRVSQGGTRTFVLQSGATRERLTIGRYPIISLSEARTEAKRILAEKTLGKHQPQTIQWDDALALFMIAVRQKNKPRTVNDYTRVFRKHFNFGKSKLPNISAADINRKLDKLLETPSEHLHALNTVKMFFNWALRKHYLDRSPCQGMQGVKGKARSRVLTDQELVSVYKAAETMGYPFGHIVRLLVLSGQRRGEIAQLKWSYINNDTITLPMEIVKNNREHTFPIGPMSQKILGNIPRTTEYVFPGERANPYFNGWDRPKKRLDQLSGITGYVLHDLRRTFSTRLAEAPLSVAPHVIERYVNHITGGTLSPIALIYNKAVNGGQDRYRMRRRVSRLPGPGCDGPGLSAVLPKQSN